MIIAPVIILVFVAVMLFSVVGGSFSNVASGGTAVSDQKALQAYADARYAEYFGDYPETYEDNLLIVFLANEDADGYDCIAWVGDNVAYGINMLFGGEGSEFGNAVYRSVNESYYAYSLDSDLASVMNTMKSEVESLGLDSSFKSAPGSDANHAESGFYNYTGLSLTETTVKGAIDAFTEATDIPTVIVVDTVEEVYGKTVNGGDIAIVVISLGLAVLAIVLIVRAIKKRANGEFDKDPDSDWEPPKL